MFVFSFAWHVALDGVDVKALLQDGHRHFSGLEEAVLKNIDACKQLSQITRTSLGPNGASIVMLLACEKNDILRSRVSSTKAEFHFRTSKLLIWPYSISGYS